jgi:hypothetical protein
VRLAAEPQLTRPAPAGRRDLPLREARALATAPAAWRDEQLTASTAWPGPNSTPATPGPAVLGGHARCRKRGWAPIGGSLMSGGYGYCIAGKSGSVPRPPGVMSRTFQIGQIKST